MRISTRGRYGLRAMLELARRFGESPVLMSRLAETEGLSRKYLHTLLTALKAAGLVRSVRGAGGGFALTRPPAEIRLDEVLFAVEGPLCLVDCVDNREVCDRSDRCRARLVWQELSSAIANLLANVTLADLIDSSEKTTAAFRGRRKGPSVESDPNTGRQDSAPHRSPPKRNC